jgi:hypothetical protein
MGFETEPSTTNQKDFAFLLGDLSSRMKNFKAFFNADSWANDIQDAILQCIQGLQQAATWAAVEKAKSQLLDHGRISTDG